jgi:hypothetical protein
MHKNYRHLRSGAANRCSVCSGRFGLIRHYSWGTPLCCKRCVEQFRARREADRKWLCLPRAA